MSPCNQGQILHFGWEHPGSQPGSLSVCLILYHHYWFYLWLLQCSSVFVNQCFVRKQSETMTMSFLDKVLTSLALPPPPTTSVYTHCDSTVSVALCHLPFFTAGILQQGRASFRGSLIYSTYSKQKLSDKRFCCFLIQGNRTRKLRVIGPRHLGHYWTVGAADSLGKSPAAPGVWLLSILTAVSVSGGKVF